MSSIFTKIITGEIPCYKLFEDEFTFAFMDIRPIHPGHSLIVPKTEVDHFTVCESPEYERVFTNARVISKAIKQATNCERVGLMVAGFEVPHFHLHMVPAWGLTDFDFTKGKERTEEELKTVHQNILKYL